MARLPIVLGDNNAWGSILNAYLGVSHGSDGAIATTLPSVFGGAITAVNSGSQSVTLPNGTTYTINNYFNPTASSTQNQYGIGVNIAGGSAGPTTLARIGVGVQAQTGGTAGNQIEAANFVVQQNAGDTAATCVGIETNVNNNKTDDATDLSGALHIAYSAVNGGSKIGAYAYGISASTVAWRRGLRCDQGAITSTGYLIEYKGDGSNGVFRVGANVQTEIGTGVLNSHLTPGVYIAGGTPGFSVQETDQAANSRVWDCIANGGVLTFRTLADDLSTQQQFLTVSRTGTTVSNFQVNSTTITWTGYGAGTGVMTVGAADSGGAGFRVLRVPN